MVLLELASAMFIFFCKVFDNNTIVIMDPENINVY